MSSADQRQSSATTGRGSIKKPFTLLPGCVDSPTAQSPFPGEAPSAVELLHPATYQTSPAITRPLSEPVTPPDVSLPSTGSPTSVKAPGVTRTLPENTSPGATRPLDLQTAVFPYLKTTPTTALRQPVVIRGSGKKSGGLQRPPKGRRWVVQLA